MVEAVDTPPPPGSPVKEFPETEPPDTGPLTTTLPRRAIVFPPSPKPSEPPDTVGNNRISTASYCTHQVCLVVVIGKVLEKIRVKWAFVDKVRLKWKIDELGVILNLMGQMDILHSNILHVFSSYQHTFPLLFRESLSRNPLSSVIGHAYTMQYKLGQCCSLMGQTQDNFCCLKEVVIWAGIDLLGFNSDWAISKGGGKLKLRGKDYISALHYGKKVRSSTEHLSKANAEETSLLFKFMPKVRNLDHFSKPHLTANKEYYKFVLNHTNDPCELSTNSLMIRMDDQDALIICGEGVERSSNTEILLRGENVLMLINKESRERIMNKRIFFRASLASKDGRMEVMKFNLDWPVVVMLSFVIGLACCDVKNVEMEASPATNAFLNMYSCIQHMAAKVLTFLVIRFGNCYLILEGEYSFSPTSMESIEVLYVIATSLRNDLEASFSYSPRLANEIMLSCRKKIATLNNQNRKKEVTTLMCTLQFENCTLKDIVNDGVVMFLEIAEETIFDILDVANEFVLVSMFNVFDIWKDVLVTVLVDIHMKQGNVSCARGIIVWKALIGMYGKKGECEYAFEIISLLYSSLLTRQWDPGKFNVLMSVAAYEFCRRIAFISHGDGIHIVAQPYDHAWWNTMIWGYGIQGNLVLSFIVMSWHSSFLVREQDSLEGNFPMVVVAVNKVCWGMLSTFYGLHNFVFDRGKTRRMGIDVRYHKWDTIKGTLQVIKLRLFSELMSQVEVCQQGNYMGQIGKDICSLNKSIPSLFSNNLMSLIVVRRAMVITSNLEDKVDNKGAALIGTQLRMVGQNSDTGKYSKERELGDMASSQVCYKRRKER
jgi:hypothetical protein